MKSTGSYKMSKVAKRALSTILDKHRRGEVKKILINGELTSEAMAKSRGRAKTPTED